MPKPVHLAAGLRVAAKAVMFCLVVLLGLAVGVVPSRANSVPIGSASNFALLFEGGGANTLQVTNVMVNGSVGVGGTGLMTDSGPSIILNAAGTGPGTIYFSAANTGQFSNNNAADVFSGPIFNSSLVTSALTTVNTLNATLAGEPGTNVSIGTGAGQTLTINASAGVSDGHGNRVFTVTGFNTTNSNVLTINGDAAGDNVVLNFAGSVNFNNQVVLKGLTDDQVLYNFVGGSNLSGGPTLQINDNASSYGALGYDVHGIFLDPNGPVSVTNANVFGRVFGGDSHDFQYVSGSAIDIPPSPVPEPSTLLLLGTGLMGMVGAARRKWLG